MGKMYICMLSHYLTIVIGFVEECCLFFLYWIAYFLFKQKDSKVQIHDVFFQFTVKMFNLWMDILHTYTYSPYISVLLLSRSRKSE